MGAAARAASLLVLAGCGTGEDPQRAASPAANPVGQPTAAPWATVVAARISNASHSFIADAGGFSGAVPEHGLAGWFDANGARLSQRDDATGAEDGEITVRAVGWGRGDATDEVLPTSPALGDCVAAIEDPEGKCVRRVEFDGGGLTEWWTGSAEGFEQGWTIDAAPDGGGPLVIDVGVDGAESHVGADGVWLLGAEGEEWIVSALEAWDADGRPLGARFEVVPGGFRVIVADAGARYPIVVDPVYSTASTTLTGTATSRFGSAVSGAGDVNNDGYDDVIVGAYYIARAYVYHGSAAGVSTTAATTLVGSVTYFGWSVSSAGDVNNDGYSDVIVGMGPGASSTTYRAFVYLGSASGVATTVSTTLTSSALNTYFGDSVSDAGDVNGDGYDDVIVGAYTDSSSLGHAYVYLGSATGVSTTVSATLSGSATSGMFGRSVSGAGDVNNDGYGDVIVGAPLDASGWGRAYLYHGSSMGLSTTASATLTGPAHASRFGDSASCAGDVNNDGYDDVIVGSREYVYYTGRADVYLGSVTGVSTTASTTLTGETVGTAFTSGDYFGYSVSGAGDLNGDGYDDVLVGAPYYSSAKGRAYVYDGSATGVSNTASTTLTGETSSLFGLPVAAAGDVNNDGKSDAIVGAQGYSAYTGRAYVYHGYAVPVDRDGDGYLSDVDCDDANTSVHPGAAETVADGIDQDCDGVDSCYTDADGDNFGTTVVVDGSSLSCSSGTGATVSTDCNDGNSAINPAASETVADGIDQDCDNVDSCYTDADGDNYGTAVVVDGSSLSCSTGTGAPVSTDCNDSSSSINPAASETVADSVDQDCDGVDSCYNDADGDNYGTTVVVDGSSLSCFSGTGAPVATDCDDGDSDTFPGAASIDSSTACMNDDDGDNYGDQTVSGSVNAGTDCNDATSAVHPGASETVADGVDQDCDNVDSCYADADGDDYGTASVVDGSSLSCSTGAGAPVATDCDDGNAAIHPLATETVADGIDQDCDSVDSCYTDSDGDNYGTAVVSDGSSLSCSTGAGAAVSTDCDDTNAAVNPVAMEAAGDGIDQNCDGVDSCYADADGDNYGTSAVVDGSSLSCASGTGAPVSTDCDDSNSAIHPGALETVADGIDQDCDAVDSCYTDADGDNYGTAVVIDGSSLSCASGSGAAVSTDCNDGSSLISPLGIEVVADSIDQDCDGVDSCYTDSDGDDYGTAVIVDGTSLSCSSGSGAPVSTDCDDANSTINPGAPEIVADGVDQDCDTVDSCYTDADGDNYGTSVVVDGSSLSCASGTGAAVFTDCNDANSTINPLGAEIVADGIDQDCDGVDSCYTDADGDDYGTAVIVDGSSLICSTGSGAPGSTDCNDANSTINPGAPEIVADGIDQDCDTVDSCYTDADGDNYGTTVVVDGSSLSCASGTGAAVFTDCNDANSTINPLGAEIVADGIDQDCDGIDSCYNDSDGDDYGTAVVVDGSSMSCSAGTGAPVATDCDDANSTINPGAAETVADGIDQDCDSVDSCYTDADGDNYGTTVVGDGSSLSCASGSGATSSTDCNDGNSTIHPLGAEMVADSIDQDCDGVDSCYTDSDGDDFGTVVVVDGSSMSCATGTGATVSTDCDDNDPSVNPEASEAIGDGIDSDCDGTELCYADDDDDGYRADDAATVHSADGDCGDIYEALAADLTGDCNDADAAYNPGALEDDCADPNDYNCDGSVGYVDADADGFAACQDCNDGDASVFPGATDVPADAVDQDCDGVELCFVDADDDGYRPDSTSMVSTTNLACDGAGEALATDPTADCNDADAAVNPAATEVAGDGVDGDCDGMEYCYVDVDGDGYTVDGSLTAATSDILCDGPGEALAGTPAGDCDDASASYNPGAIEDDCTDPADYNCDGSSGYADGDGDGYAACEECDDAQAAVNPDATELCNGLDDDCDGTIDLDAADAETWYADADGDGFTDPTVFVTACTAPGGYAAATVDDCDDADNTVFPGADDIPDDGIDQDCDGYDAPSSDTGDSSADSNSADDTSPHDSGQADGTGDGKGCGCESTDAGGGIALMLGALASVAWRRRGK